MKKSRSVINGLVLCILIATFLGEILFHILQKEKIVTKNRPCSRGLTTDRTRFGHATRLFFDRTDHFELGSSYLTTLKRCVILSGFV